MSRLILVHWDEQECEARAERLRASGHSVECRWTADAFTPRALSAIAADPPDAVIIDLVRLPSQGRDIGAALRRSPGTRHFPLIFVAGDAEKTQRVRELLPDAGYSTWADIEQGLARAIDGAPAEPVTPGAFDAYSGTPLPKKLGIRAGMDIALLDAPPDFAATLGELPPDTRLLARAGGNAAIVLLFVRSQADLERRFAAAARSVGASGRLWIVWPKKASGVETDVTQSSVRAYGLAAGWVDFKISAIDRTWSGLCFARRR